MLFRGALGAGDEVLYDHGGPEALEGEALRARPGADELP